MFRDLLAGGGSAAASRRLAVAPKKGQALVFFPVDGSGEVDFRTLHAGEPTHGEEKWLAQLWLHEGRYDAEVPQGTSQAEAEQLGRRYCNGAKTLGVACAHE